MTRTEVELAVTLSQRITLITEEQADEFGYSSAAARLLRRGLLTRKTIVFRPLVPGDEPLAVHRPGECFSQNLARDVSNSAAARAAATPMAEVVVYQATQRAYAVWGDAARKTGNPFAYSHDHALSAVYLRLRPDDRLRWRFEPVRGASGPELYEKIPDAALTDDRGDPVSFQELVGASYTAERLTLLALHADTTLAHRAGRANAGIIFW